MAALLAGIRNVLTPATIHITLEGEASLPTVPKPGSTDPNEKILLFSSRDPVKGTVSVVPLAGKKIEYTSITCEFIGVIETFGEKSQSNQFITVTKELDQVGIITSTKAYNFDFTSIKKEYETYYGVNVSLRFAVIDYASILIYVSSLIHFLILNLLNNVLLLLSSSAAI